MKIEVIEGDITKLDVDAIVNAANDHLWMGAGVAGAIKRAGGQAIEDEAIALGPIPVGSAVATTAGKLAAKWIIHGAVMGQDLKTSAELIRSTTERCLLLAESLGARSIAFPAFGTGVGGFPIDECAALMSCVVLDYGVIVPSGPDVVFAVFGEEARRAFDAALTMALRLA